jgi:DNA-binding CsgD family transcriptional regulator
VVAQLFAKDQSPLDTLTAREREVLELMAQGHINATIAELLFVTERAVSKHIEPAPREIELAGVRVLLSSVGSRPMARVSRWRRPQAVVIEPGEMASLIRPPS